MTTATPIPPRRNAPCPCGSGKRYKDCCGALGGETASGPASRTTAAAPTVAAAEAAWRAGQAARAAAMLEALRQSSPEEPRVWLVSGVVAGARGEHADALTWLRHATVLAPRMAEAWMNLGNVQLETGDTAAAEESLRRAVSLAPQGDLMYYNLAMLLRRTGRTEEARAALWKVVSMVPEHGRAWLHLCTMLREEGRHGEGLQVVDQALARLPRDTALLLEQASLLRFLGRDREAVPVLRRAHQGNPRHYGAELNLANVLRRIGAWEEALTHLQALCRGAPDVWAAHSNLGLLYAALGRLDEAGPCHDRAVALAPEQPEAWRNRADWLSRARRPLAAVASLEKALEYSGADTDLAPLLAALCDAGRSEEAVQRWRERAAAGPTSIHVHTAALFALSLVPGVSGAEIMSAHRQYMGEHLGWLAPPAPVVPAGDGPLRLGFVSADLRQHPVGRFLLPLLERLDRRAFAVHAFSAHAYEDDLTAQIKSLCDGWHSLVGIDTAAAARLVREAGIHILIDLSGLTMGNRLDLFAARPAPVQAGWLGYLSTTGLASMDWRITDGVADPAGAEARHSEALARLPRPQWCYRPHDGAPEPGPLPARAAGHVTFASFNQLAKLNRPLLQSWARILTALPDARLLITAVNEPSPHLLAPFEDAGVAGRVELLPRTGLDEFLTLHQRVDIALDSHPYAGGTTTCDSLWMGVPVLTCTGDTSVSRSGASILSALYLDELVTDSLPACEALALALARDLPRLEELRGRLRPRMQASPLTDAEGFARDFGVLMLELWRQAGG